MSIPAKKTAFLYLTTNKYLRYLILVILLLIGLLVLVREADHLRINDFVEYWSAARITMNGGNPYSPDELLSMENQGGWNLPQPVMMYSPPWILPLLIPFGIINRSISQLLWMLYQIGVLLFCANYIWQMYGGNKKQSWVAWIFTFTFAPVVGAVLFQGQISPLILLGLVCFFLFLDKPKQIWLAGATFVLISIKPQVSYLFIMALLIWLIYTKRWSFLVYSLIVIVLLSIIVIAFNPNIFFEYFEFIFNNAPTAWATPTIGTFLRILFFPTGFQLQFLAPLIGLIWLSFYWRQHHNNWNWKNQIPLIMFVSSITSPYIWTFDMVILLFPLLQTILWITAGKKIWIAVCIILIYTVINFLFLRLHLTFDDSVFIWFAPTLFILYIVLKNLCLGSTSIQTINQIT